MLKNSLPYIAMIIMLASCLQQPEVCQIETIRVAQSSIEKTNLKSDIEFISIAYYDLLQQQITNNQLDKLYKTYLAIGDKKLVGELIVNSLIEKIPAESLPKADDMRKDVDAFVIDTYNKFYKREPNEFELWQMSEAIKNNANLEPLDLYYAFISSDEYKYF